MTARISLLLPLYKPNHSWLRALISSLNIQTFQDWQLIVCFDAKDLFSSSTQSLILSLLREDRFCRFLQAVTPGIAGTLNYGLRFCDTPYIARIDADDILEKTRLERQIQFLSTHPEYIGCGSQIIAIGEEGQMLENKLYKYPTSYYGTLFFGAFINNPIAHPTLFFRSSAINLTGNYKPIPCAEDYDLISRMLRYGKIASLQSCELFYRIHDQQLSVKTRPPRSSLLLIRLRFSLLLLAHRPFLVPLLAIPFLLYLIGSKREAQTRSFLRTILNSYFQRIPLNSLIK